MMEIFSGFRTVCAGVSIGTVEIESETVDTLPPSNGNGYVDELSVSPYESYLSALLRLKNLLSSRLHSCTDGDMKDIIECQLIMLDDEDLADEIKNALSLPESNADTVSEIYKTYAKRIFVDTLPELFALRVEDLICLGTIISNIMRRETYYSNAQEKIVFCDHVRLSHVLLWPNIVGVVEQVHIASTHASMLLKAHGIPAVEGIRAELSWQGKMAILDADRGQLIIDPTEDVIRTYRAKADLPFANTLMTHNIPEVIKLLATINSVDDALALSAVSETSVNVGLIRTEMLFINQSRLPDEAEQYSIYQQISDLLPSRTLTFRSFDFGGDKFDSMPESWKMQGITRDHKGVLGTLAAEEDFLHQIRAIIRLSRHCKVRILFPYVTDSDQLSRIDELIKSIYAEEEFFNLVPIEKGFMIENTSALAIINEIIAYSDFVSVGTNDLLKSLFPSVITQSYDGLGDSDWSRFAHIIQELATAVHVAHKQLILCGEVILNNQFRPYLNSVGIDCVSLTTQSLESVCLRRKQ